MKVNKNGPSDLEKIFTYLADAEKERNMFFNELNDKIEELLEMFEEIKSKEKIRW